MVPALACAIALAAIAPLRPDESARSLDLALAALLGGIAVQLVPLPGAVGSWLSPGREPLVAALSLAPPPAWAPLSINPADTVYALAVVLSAILTFASCRTIFAHRGRREVCRGIGWLGLLLACTGMVQRAVSPDRIYGFWAPHDTGALPFGPFINRNHAATWLVMGASVCVGYLMARLHGPGSRAAGVSSLRQSADSRTVWLAIAGITMVIGIGVSLSRSGALALGTAAAGLLAAGRPRLSRSGTFWIVGVAVVAGAVFMTLGQFATLVGRVVDTAVSGPPGRSLIWRDTLSAVGDFWLTGGGAGTYERMMFLYQTTDRAYYFNQAHNHYLQVLAEGGLLLVVPLLLALGAFARVARERLRADRSGMFWIRAGSAAGLVGIAVQSGWETGLRLPANAQMAAVLAALVIHPVTSLVESEHA